ncbi:hypothetical protein LTR47_008620 [Exophiala xenobiotica]|nr:hypothetical protein LTR41_010274 [Exophiala xenobiotica]KAK5227579.1 hypothetical protein LTR47_008620 [Exophiala xenobiotica]KAK5249743.1 hypothetical protein LTS06_005378 [Exophiala xenobiotica]KAK5346557.1 hypothetical protein LTR61_009760 [Exophiala xenobiotica]KAK5362911.1 hypothetical protein LTS03_009857 [Exophiala xenobiotica]
MDPSPVPPYFIILSEASSKVGTNQQYNVIGVCIDYLDPTKSRTGDDMFTFTLHDPWWTGPSGTGMKFRFFSKTEKLLPKVENQGDVVILRNVKTMNVKGELVGISNSASNWVVLPCSALRELESFQDLQTKAEWFGKGIPNHYPQAALPNAAELKYAKYIAASEDTMSWRPLATTTRPQMKAIMEGSGGQAPALADKFRLIQDLQLGKFADIFGEVRKIHFKDNLPKTEVHVTDYTSQQALYNRTSESSAGGLDGDQYGYTEDLANPAPSKWPGPWGPMTIEVLLFEPHSSVARKIIRPGCLVLLRNVQIKMDPNGTKLEGVCRTDTYYLDKVNVEVIKPHKNDERARSLISRKQQYEKQAKAEGKVFYWSPLDMPLDMPKKRKADEINEKVEEEQKSKPGKNAKRKKKENRTKAGTTRQEGQAGVGETNVESKSNTNVRCNSYEVPRKSIVDILDTISLERRTPEGNLYKLPFQNCKYKSHVRVVDFFPDNIADFAVPRNTDMDLLSDDEAGEDLSGIDLSQDHGNRIGWEWRFFLLVEDARQPTAPGERPTRMELLVADTDGDFLLNMTACNLRDNKHAQQLAALKEKLFILWGDLQEKKEEISSTAEASSVKPSARPFECLIKEYGVPIRNSDEQVKGTSEYDRVFRLFGTTI